MTYFDRADPWDWPRIILEFLSRELEIASARPGSARQSALELDQLDAICAVARDAREEGRSDWCRRSARVLVEIPPLVLPAWPCRSSRQRNQVCDWRVIECRPALQHALERRQRDPHYYSKTIHDIVDVARRDPRARALTVLNAESTIAGLVFEPRPAEAALMHSWNGSSISLRRVSSSSWYRGNNFHEHGYRDELELGGES